MEILVGVSVVRVSSYIHVICIHVCMCVCVCGNIQTCTDLWGDICIHICVYFFSKMGVCMFMRV